MARQHGIGTDTYQQFIIDSGAVYKNYGEGSQALLGATRGGNTFTITPEVRDMEADGARGPVVGSRRITQVGVKLVANFVQINNTLIPDAIPGSTAVDNTTFHTHTRALQLAVADHLTNVALVGELTGTPAVPVILICKNALADGAFEIGMTDKEEAVLTVEFTAHFLVADLDTEPWEIRYPETS